MDYVTLWSTIETNNTQEDQNALKWFASTFAPYNKFLQFAELLLEIVGVFFNCVTCDTSRLVPETSGTFWMGYLAVWDSLFLVVCALRSGFAVFGVQLASLGTLGCQLFAYFWWVTGTNASAHLVILAVDRALSIALATWHYRQCCAIKA